jgi:hypothetical protein
MRRASTQACAFAATVVGLVAIFGALATIFQPNATTASSSAASASTTPIIIQQSSSYAISTGSSNPALAASCLLPEEAGANVTIQIEGDIPGTLVSHASGQHEFYHENMCPQPISNKTYEYGADFPNVLTWVPTSNYQLALAAVTNQKFISLENGTDYFYSQPGSYSLSSMSADSMVIGPVNGTYGYTFELLFYHYGDSISKCFGQERFNVTAGIAVDFFAPAAQYSVGSRPIGSWNMNDPSVSALTPGRIMELNLCVST